MINLHTPAASEIGHSSGPLDFLQKYKLKLKKKREEMGGNEETGERFRLL